MDLKLNEQEQEQSRIPTLAMQKAIIYTNDLFSWAKEKAEQEAVAANKNMFSAVAVLMKEHRISEKQALDLLREKTIECERDHFAAVSDLERAGPISENLYRYLDMTRLCHSGGMLWSALTDRYNRAGVGQTNVEVTKKDQFSLASSAEENSAKMGVSISISNNTTRANGDTDTDGVLLVEDHAAKANESVTKGDTKHHLNGTNKTVQVLGNDVTLKAYAQEVGILTAPL